MPKKRLIVPEGYEDVTVKQYKNMLDALEGENHTDKEVAIKVVSALCEITQDELKHVDWFDVTRLMEMVSWIIEAPDLRETKHPLIREFTMNGVDYGFIPNWTKLTLGEFADLETYSSQGAFDNLEKILALLYRPIEKRSVDSYRIAPYEPHSSKQEAMLECKMDAAISAMVFFYRIGRVFVIDSQRSLKRVKKVQTT